MWKQSVFHFFVTRSLNQLNERIATLNYIFFLQRVSNLSALLGRIRAEFRKQDFYEQIVEGGKGGRGGGGPITLVYSIKSRIT